MSKSVQETLVDEVHKPARRNYPRRRVEVRGINESFQIDLVDMQKYASENKGYNYILTVIDNVSKYGWAIPLKSKSANDVTEAMKSVLEQGRVPKNIQGDDGKEFFNYKFKTLMKQYGINLYSTYSSHKASICERYNKTIKTMMWKLFTLNGNHKWIDILPIIIAKYNESKHRTIGMSPIEVNKNNEELVLKRIRQQEYYIIKQKKPKFKVGDTVHISRYKRTFEKGYTMSWTPETFTVTEVRKTKPHTYYLKEYTGEPIKGAFYEEELQKTAYPDMYLIERIIRKKGDKVYVKWLGYDNTQNSWIDKKDIE